MKNRWLSGLIALTLVFCWISFSLAQAVINGKEIPGAAPGPLQTISCKIVDIYGNTVSTVYVSDSWKRNIKGYFVDFYSGTAWTKAVVTLSIVATGHPEKTMTQTFSFSQATVASITTPFAITDWATAAYPASAKVTVTIKTYSGATLLNTAIMTVPLARI